MTDAAARLSDIALDRVAAPKARVGVLNAAYVATVIVVTVLVTIPIVALVYGSFRTAAPGLPGEWTLRNYAGLGSMGVIGTIGTTLWIGFLTSALCIVIGTAIALSCTAPTSGTAGWSPHSSCWHSISRPSSW